ncbi:MULTISPECIES: hypothetical protein [Klebsiella]|uniref:hypothetical protein n=1 Tax=Enterobacteriaceae TaxID=543 RepID=UPI0015F9F964|nr:hypothetical protein [Klebsiella pneumoniae]HAU5797140.1 hypothetical protein [Citrobacter amalonaticus]HAV2305997.1 hypothetical protein [Escherichia coli]HCD8362076.1 hypothetical protein [Klebsiella quasipneumoniae]MCB6165363.1 hypothetical protein [Klebsiella pneumoniae]MCB6166045.1 hypothetical protein [Klebsiella pneumoniae]
MSIYLNFPPPANWQDFQILTLRLVEQMCEPDTVREYGRQGQRQDGIDVYGEMPGELHLGVQCKQMEPGKKLTLKLIQDEADAALVFKPDLHVFIIATTLAEDTAIHKAVTTLNASKKYNFKISYWSWNHFNDKLNRSSKLMEESYGNYAKSFDDNEYLRDLEAIFEAFSRPAFIDNFKHELNYNDFLHGLGDTVLFLQTGLLRDRLTGELLRGTYPLSMLPAGESKKLRKRLHDEVKNLRKRALEDYSNGQLDQSKAQEYNASRYLLISEVNKLFLSSGMPVIVPLYGF